MCVCQRGSVYVLVFLISPKLKREEIQMGRAPCCYKVGLHRGLWTASEDAILINYIQAHGEGDWKYLPKKAGLLRCGKSCRLRWKNYLHPNIKRGNITADEDDLIFRLHSLLGNRWSLIAGRLPGRTDNEIKNYWNTHLSRRLKNPTTNPDTLKVLPKEGKAKNKTKTNTHIEKKRKKNKHMGNEDTTKTKIHHPKPIRVSSLPIIKNNCFDDMESRGEREKGGNHTQVSDLSWSWFDLSDVSFDFPCNYHIPTKDGMLEKVYEEYQQLIRGDEIVQLDSFVESLLV
ncbi:hypothetical protein L1049_022836 [Liquidambar formosana]|uniref:Uncharacterized protein n=1 Tax=Liquidambar formosana TaxID=63359 RepID=A0AAP0RD22_LIQFO